MTGLDDLNKFWEAASARPIAPEMSFDGDCLVLGAQTRLTKIERPPQIRLRRPPRPRQRGLPHCSRRRTDARSRLRRCRHIQCALEKKRDGDLVLALIHLALSGVAKLRDPKEDARRLFLADALMSEGVDPSVIVKGLGFDPSPPDEALDKYSPDQPRVPAGDPDGGQWTSGDWEGGSSGSPSRRTSGVPVAHASAARGDEIRTGAAPTAPPQAAAPPAASSTADPNGQPFELAQDLDQTCSAFIATNCRAGILRVFPGQYLTCTLREVLAAAKAGDRAGQYGLQIAFSQKIPKIASTGIIG